MADYTIQTDTQLDPDAPLTSELAYGWRDNLIAAFEGASGAPRLALGSLVRLTTGSVVRVRDDDVKNIGDVEEVVAYCRFMQPGSVTLSLQQTTTSGATSTVDVKRQRAGTTSTLTTWTTTSESWVSRSLTVAVRPGDYVYVTSDYSSTSGFSSTRYHRISTGGEEIFYGAPGYMETDIT